MNSVAALMPVILLIACGWGVAKIGWVKKEHVASLANLVFLFLLPALLFRSMARVGFAGVDYYPIFIYLGVAEVIFLSVAFYLGRTPKSFVIGLSCIFSNHMMVGIPLIAIAYGEQALVTLITLVSVHALVLLTFATVLLEWSIVREEQAKKGITGLSRSSIKSLLRVLGKTIYRAIVHPVILPIAAGVLWSLTGWPLPEVIDKVLLMLGQANGALSLILVGIMLAFTKINGELLRKSMVISLIKTLIFPALVFAACWFLGVRGLPLAVLTIGAGLPIGNNVYLFSMRNKLAEDLITASIAMSVLTSMVILAVIMVMLGHWVL